VVHNLVHEKLKADKKVARPKSSEQEPGAVENFKKELAQKLISVFKEVKKQSLRECDIGVKMKPAGIENFQRRKLTSRGVKPVGSLQFSRGKYYVYGVEPESGDNFSAKFLT